MEKGLHRRKKLHLRDRLGGGISVVHTDLEVPFKSLKI